MTPGNILSVDRRVAENLRRFGGEHACAEYIRHIQAELSVVPMRCLFVTTFTVGQTTYLPCARFRILTHCLVLAWKWRDTQISGFVPSACIVYPSKRKRREEEIRRIRRQKTKTVVLEDDYFDTKFYVVLSLKQQLF